VRGIYKLRKKKMLNNDELKELHEKWVAVAKEKAILLDMISLQGRYPNENEQKTINLLTEKENRIFWEATGWELNSNEAGGK